MIKYKMDLSEEKKDAAINIALESKGNIRKRQKLKPICYILSILEIIIGIYYCTKASYTSGIILLLLGIFIAILGYTAKDFQRYVLKKSEKLLDKSFRSGIVEYTFDTKGITISSNIGESINYWNAFKEYGTFGEYIYVKRKDNKMILIDKNHLTNEEKDELLRLLACNLPQ